MHELSLTQSMVDAIVERMGDARITRVRLEIGKLSGVVVDSIRFCFDLVAAGTAVEGAALEVEEPSGSCRCRDCSERFTVDDPIVLCPRCDGANVEVLSGRDIRIRSVEVMGECAPPVAAPTTPEYG
jgi:hydrogenase nickel incorporation protein HypA/HybF